MNQDLPTCAFGNRCIAENCQFHFPAARDYNLSVEVSEFLRNASSGSRGGLWRGAICVSPRGASLTKVVASARRFMTRKSDREY